MCVRPALEENVLEILPHKACLFVLYALLDR